MEQWNRQQATAGATWQGGLAAYVEGGKDALQMWLEKQGVKNIEALNEVLHHGAQPWCNIYGGRDQIEIVNGPNRAL
jgi:tagatose 1,6-diphosphate aldolase